MGGSGSGKRAIVPQAHPLAQSRRVNDTRFVKDAVSTALADLFGTRSPAWDHF